MIVSCLHADAVNESLAGYFVVRLQDIMKVLDRVVIVVHWMILNDVVKPGNFAVLAVGE